MQHMLNAGADVVVVGTEKDLRLVLQAAERLGMQDGGLVTVVAATDVIGAGGGAPFHIF